MKKITVPTIDEVSPESKIYFENMQKRLGKVPNLYATMGYSSHALKAFLDMDAALSGGVLRAKQREAVALVVSEINGCQYCLAGHTLAAIKNGLTKEETLEIRKGHATDPQLNAIVQLAKSMAQHNGHAEQQFLDQFFEAGFDEAALMDLIALVALRIYTNYVFAATAIPVDYPLAEPIS